MSAFHDTRQIERRVVERLLPLLKERAYDGRFVLTNKGPLAPYLQTTVGDVLLNSDPDRIWGIEIKGEVEQRTKNLFLELFSNRKWGTLGWLPKLKADLLFYYFLDTDALYVIDLPKLQNWAFSGDEPIWQYPFKPQKKYTQLNDTWGACVPLEVIGREVGYKLLYSRQLQLDLPPGENHHRALPLPTPPPREWEQASRVLRGLRMLESICLPTRGGSNHAATSRHQRRRTNDITTAAA